MIILFSDWRCYRITSVAMFIIFIFVYHLTFNGLHFYLLFYCLLFVLLFCCCLYLLLNRWNISSILVDSQIFCALQRLSHLQTLGKQYSRDTQISHISRYCYCLIFPLVVLNSFPAIVNRKTQVSCNDEMKRNTEIEELCR